MKVKMKYELTESNVKDLIAWMRQGNNQRVLNALVNLIPRDEAALAQPVQPAIKFKHGCQWCGKENCEKHES